MCCGCGLAYCDYEYAVEDIDLDNFKSFELRQYSKWYLVEFVYKNKPREARKFDTEDEARVFFGAVDAYLRAYDEHFWGNKYP